MENAKKLLPENDLQELWEQNGRICAVIAYLNNEYSMPYETKRRLLAMLGREEG